jgi:hypothetical protein
LLLLLLLLCVWLHPLPSHLQATQIEHIPLVVQWLLNQLAAAAAALGPTTPQEV